MPTEKWSASVLVVEDDPDYCQLLNEAFVEAGFRTLLAGNGERALEILRTESVDLVVSDFIMPEINGLELCRLLGEDMRPSRPKVILYSCNHDNVFRRKARELGAIEYLPKTDDTESLVRQVCQLAGLAGTSTPGAASADWSSEDRLRTVARNAEQLKTFMDSLLDFTRILALSGEQTPATKLAWDAVQRTGVDIRKILNEMESLTGEGAPQVQAELGSR